VHTDRPVTFAVVGAGNRGGSYGRWMLANPELARAVAVAEPGRERRERFAAAHGIEAGRALDDWRSLVELPRLSDAAIVATQDGDHVGPVLALLEKGYHVLLEKPIAPTEEECRAVARAAQASGRVFAVCHVLLYTPLTRLVKQVVDSGRLGQVVSVQHLEPVGYWHQAHSYVRGSWRRADASTFMLMAKSCHDVDWLQHVVGEPIARVASFGNLRHFRPENAPPGAAPRCVDCPLAGECPYSATAFYRGLLDSGATGWPLDAVVDVPTRAALDEALERGPYGRCVYACDNDVVDHQVVALEFAGGASGVFTMTAFDTGGPRRTTIFGSHGELVTDGERVEVREFGGRTEVLFAEATGGATGDATAGGGHGGGDAGLMAAFVRAVATGDTGGILSGPAASLASHRAVFAAERARLTGTVQALDGPAS
jgi:predicted dehydrogenase